MNQQAPSRADSIGGWKQDPSRVRYYGLMKGLVEQRTDPQRLGRLRVRVVGIHGPDIAVEELPWASPKTNAWDQGGDAAIPPLGQYCWVQFEDGHIEYPVWEGGWWAAPTPETLETPNGTRSAKNVLWPTTLFSDQENDGTARKAQAWEVGTPLQLEGFSGIKPEDAPNNYIQRSPLGKHLEADDRKNLQKIKLSDQLDNYTWTSTEWGCTTHETSRGLQWDAKRGKFRGWTFDAYAEKTQIFDTQGWRWTVEAAQAVKKSTWNSPSGFKMLLDELNGRIEVWTPLGQRLILDDPAGRVIMQSIGQWVMLDSKAQLVEIKNTKSLIHIDDKNNVASWSVPGALNIVAGANINVSTPGEILMNGSHIGLNDGGGASASSPVGAQYSLPANPALAKRAPEYKV